MRFDGYDLGLEIRCISCDDLGIFCSILIDLIEAHLHAFATSTTPMASRRISLDLHVTDPLFGVLEEVMYLIDQVTAQLHVEWSRHIRIIVINLITCESEQNKTQPLRAYFEEFPWV